MITYQKIPSFILLRTLMRLIILVFVCSYAQVVSARSIGKVAVEELVETSDLIAQVNILSKRPIDKDSLGSLNCGSEYKANILRLYQSSNSLEVSANVTFGKVPFLVSGRSYLLFLKNTKTIKAYRSWAEGIDTPEAVSSNLEVDVCESKSPSLSYFPHEVWELSSSKVYFLTGIPKDFPVKDVIKFPKGQQQFVYGAHRSVVDAYLGGKTDLK